MIKGLGPLCSPQWDPVNASTFWCHRAPGRTHPPSSLYLINEAVDGKSEMISKASISTGPPLNHGFVSWAVLFSPWPHTTGAFHDSFSSGHDPFNWKQFFPGRIGYKEFTNLWQSLQSNQVIKLRNSENTSPNVTSILINVSFAFFALPWNIQTQSLLYQKVAINQLLLKSLSPQSKIK